MPGLRLAVPAVVVIVFSAGLALRSIKGRAVKPAWIVVGAVVVIQAMGLFGIKPERDDAAAIGATVGRFLEAHLPAEAWVACATAGSTTYFAPSLNFIDTLGINDRHIALRTDLPIVTKWQSKPGHVKGDGAYVLERNPDVVIIGPSQGYLGEKPDAWFLTDYELLTSPVFLERYKPYRFKIPITETEREHPTIAKLLVGPKKIRLIAWLRQDSEAAKALAEQGKIGTVTVPVPRDRHGDCP